jgi:hypothetical protein
MITSSALTFLAAQADLADGMQHELHRPLEPVVKKRRFVRRVAIGGATLAAAAAVTAPSALAAGSTPGNVYQGCLSSAIGALYNIKVSPLSAPSCMRRDSVISWNQIGPQGPKGDTGEAGPQGPKGDAGAAGAAGTKGDTGPQGDPGQQGIAGPQGPQGDPGPAGAGGLLSYSFRSVQFNVPDHQLEWVKSIQCSTGYRVISGGAWLQSDAQVPDIAPVLLQSAPIDDHTWEVKVENLANRGYQYAITIVCAQFA